MSSAFGKRLATTVTGFGLLATAAVVFAPLVGSTPISLRRVFDPATAFAENADAQIFFIARLPRTLALTGEGRSYIADIRRAFEIIAAATGDLRPQPVRLTISVTGSVAALPAPSRTSAAMCTSSPGR